MCVHVSYMKGCMYMCTYARPTWWLCVCVHTYKYIPFRYNPQVGHTHNAYPAPGRMDTHTFQNTHTFSTHSPCRTNAHMYIPPSRQDIHYPLCTHLPRRANTYTYHYIIIVCVSYLEDGIFVHVCFLCGGVVYICVLPVLHIRFTHSLHRRTHTHTPSMYIPST